MLTWQRNTFLCLISIMDLLLQLDEPSKTLDSARLLKELINLAGSWVQAGIKAACGHSGQPDDSSPSGSVTAGRDANFLKVCGGCGSRLQCKCWFCWCALCAPRL
jgi:hypothetical protein